MRFGETARLDECVEIAWSNIFDGKISEGCSFAFILNTFGVFLKIASSRENSCFSGFDGIIDGLFQRRPSVTERKQYLVSAIYYVCLHSLKWSSFKS